MTPEKFQRGLQDYIRKYAFKNATLVDFIATLQTQTDRDLKTWADRWFRQRGADQLSAKWTCENGRAVRGGLTSAASDGASHRPQAVKLALFEEKDGRLGEPTVIPVVLERFELRRYVGTGLVPDLFTRITTMKATPWFRYTP